MEAIQKAVDHATDVGPLTNPLFCAQVTTETENPTMWGKDGFTVKLPTGEVIEVEMRQVK